MVIQTVKYEILQPEPKTIEVPLDSNFGVAIGIKYQGKDIHIKQNDVLLDGQEAIDVADNKYAVFKLSSDGNEGIESYQVDTGPVGIDYVDASAYAEKPILPSPANTTIACDLSPLAGKAFVKSVITTDEEMLKAPFNLQVFNTEGEMQSTTGSPISIIYAGDANNPSASDLPIWRIQYKKNWGYRITWQKPNADYTDWINTEEPLVVPEKAYVQATYSFASVLDQGKVVFDIQHHITISSQFDLFMNKKDSGVVEGYGDDYIFKNTSNLSGTSADGTDFNFIVPIVEE